MSKYKEELHYKYRRARRRRIGRRDILTVFARKILSFRKRRKIWILKTTDGVELRSPIRADVLHSLATINDYEILPNQDVILP